MRATKAGTVVFGASAADLSPDHDVLMFGSDDVVDPNSINYLAAELMVLDDAEGESLLIEDEILDLISSASAVESGHLDRIFSQY